MTKIVSFLILILILTTTFFSEAKLTPMKNVVKGYDFWLYEPDSIKVDSLGKTYKKPVIIFLHGASLCGRNLNKVLRYGSVHAVNCGRKIDAYILAPQNPGGAWNPKHINEMLNWAIEHNSIDTTRIYVLGMSLGGYGTIDYTATYPQRVTAAMAFCGGGTAKDICKLTQVPLWIIHGTADRAVPVNQSRRIVNSMIECGDTSKLIYSEWNGVNHSRLARLFYLPQTYDWLFSHTLKDSSRSLNKNIKIENKDLDNAYKGLHFNSAIKKKSRKK